MTTAAELEAAEALLNIKSHKKPYKVICVSMYNSDIEDLADKVAILKARGWTKMNKSLLIRIALRKLDIDELEVRPQ